MLLVSCPHLQAEQADYLGGFLLLQSMAGGTGAGLGTYVAEAIRDTFPSSFLMNHCIWSDLQQNSVATSTKSADTSLKLHDGLPSAPVLSVPPFMTQKPIKACVLIAGVV